MHTGKLAGQIGFPEHLDHSDAARDEQHSPSRSFRADQASIVALLVERVDIGTEGLNVRLRVDGLTGLAGEFRAWEAA